MKKLYYIVNVGCHDITELITEMDERYALFCADLFKTMNKNAYCGCQPTIGIKEIKFISETEFYSNSGGEKRVGLAESKGRNIYFKTIKVLVEAE